jgi:hypothetical protein
MIDLLFKLKSVAIFIISVLNSFNPIAYRTAAQRSIGQLFIRFLGVLLIIAVATLIFTVPAMLNTKDAGKISKLSASIDIITRSPIETNFFQAGNAKILINTTADSKTAAKYDIVLTNKEITAKPALCMFAEYPCRILGIKKQSIPIKDIDFSKNKGTAARGILLLMIPGLLIFFYLIMAIKYLVIVLLATLAGYLIMKFTGKSTGILDTVKIAGYASIVLVLLDFVTFILSNWPIQIPVVVPIIAYFVFFSIGLAMNEQFNDDMI